MLHLNRHTRLVSSAVELQARIVMQQSKAKLGQWLCNRVATLGPTYIKMGQFISTRSDIFGKEFTAPFNALRDRVEAMSREDLIERLQHCVDLRQLMIEFDYEPIASASIAQVHKGRLRNGKQIAIKVRRPDIEAVVAHDLDFIKGILNALLNLTASGPHSESARHLREFIDDFEASIKDEINFEKEMANMVAFYNAYHGREDVIVPKVYKGLCTGDMLVMEYVPSFNVYEFKGDKRALAERLMNFFVGQLLYRGIIHGDPHPGNMGITADDKIVLYDMGNVIYISPKERQQLKDLIYQLLLGNKEMIAQTLEGLDMEVTDRKALYKYIDVYINYMKTIDFKQLNKSINEIQSMSSPDGKTGQSQEPPIKFPNKFVRLFRTYGIMEGICKELYDKFNYFDLFDSYIDGIFLDDEFILYKAAADTNKLFGDLFKNFPSAGR